MFLWYNTVRLQLLSINSLYFTAFNTSNHFPLPNERQNGTACCMWMAISFHEIFSIFFFFVVNEMKVRDACVWAIWLLFFQLVPQSLFHWNRWVFVNEFVTMATTLKASARGIDVACQSEILWKRAQSAWLSCKVVYFWIAQAFFSNGHIVSVEHWITSALIGPYTSFRPLF